jgi:hypothetical protein
VTANRPHTDRGGSVKNQQGLDSFYTFFRKDKKGTLYAWRNSSIPETKTSNLKDLAKLMESLLRLRKTQKKRFSTFQFHENLDHSCCSHVQTGALETMGNSLQSRSVSGLNSLTDFDDGLSSMILKGLDQTREKGLAPRK